jgi:hypothetical protein
MSCCGSLFVNLGGGGGGTVNTGVLQIAGGVALDSTLRFVEDQAGTDSILSISTTEIRVTSNNGFSQNWFNSAGTIDNRSVWVYQTGSSWSLYTRNDANNGGEEFFNVTAVASNVSTVSLGKASTPLTLNSSGMFFGTSPITQNGALTVKGGGANIASFRDSSNVEVASINSVGSFVAATILAGTGGYLSNTTGSRLNSSADGNWLMQNLAQNNFTALLLGGTTTSFPAIASTNTPAALAAKDATGTNLIPFSAEDFTSGNLSTGTLITARPMQFGDKATVTTGNDLGLDAQIAVEHNGNVYYIPCSTFLIT